MERANKKARQAAGLGNQPEGQQQPPPPMPGMYGFMPMPGFPPGMPPPGFGCVRPRDGGFDMTWTIYSTRPSGKLSTSVYESVRVPLHRVDCTGFTVFVSQDQVLLPRLTVIAPPAAACLAAASGVPAFPPRWVPRWVVLPPWASRALPCPATRSTAMGCPLALPDRCPLPVTWVCLR